MVAHKAKGLEFEAVFLPRLDEKELPSRFARTPEDQAEERRLFYVGITRARRSLAITWSRTPSPFLVELGIDPKNQADGKRTLIEVWNKIDRLDADARTRLRNIAERRPVEERPALVSALSGEGP